MANQRNLTQAEAIKANIYVHAFLVNAGEYQKSPHFRPENQEKVRQVLKRLVAKNASSSNSKAIDFGCGTGFMIDLMKGLFSEIHGVDITPDMMQQVDVTSGNIHLHECLAENTPFQDDTFDFATAYSFMDHLYDYKTFLKEAFRVLKPGGIFYSDLNPNRDFIAAMERIEKSEQNDLTPAIEREIKGALHNGEHYAENFGMDCTMLDQAEPIKSLDKGFDSNEVLMAAKDIGFSKCEIEFEWFFGQAKIIHGQSPETADMIDQYLTSALPISSPLYKYLRFIFTK